jgi:hypothetical protein
MIIIEENNRCRMEGAAQWEKRRTMNKQKALDSVDAAIRALTGLEQAMKHNDERSANIEIQILWLELGNLREMVERTNGKDS